MMLVLARDEKTEREWERYRRMGNLDAIKHEILTEEEIELRAVGEACSNYALPNCVQTPEGIENFNRRLRKIASPGYVAVDSREL